MIGHRIETLFEEVAFIAYHFHWPVTDILEQYQCGPAYDRHLVFDHVVPPASANRRQQFEALARSLRDMLTENSIGSIFFVLSNLHELPDKDGSTKKLFSFLRTTVADSPDQES